MKHNNRIGGFPTCFNVGIVIVFFLIPQMY